MRGSGIKKLYYSIGEVSELTGLEAHVLRYWETEFEALRPKKNRAGNRIYTEQDIELLQRIKQLLRDDKYTIEGARQALGRGPAGDPAPKLDRQELLALRGFLVEVLRRL